VSSRKKAALAVGATALAATAVVGGVAWALSSDDDPADGVGAVRLPGVSGDAVGAGSSTTDDGRQVAALDELRGTVTADDDGDLVVDGVELDFGPDEWVRTAGEVADLDGDGTTAGLETEIAALEGREVVLLVRLDDDGDEAEVFVVDDVTYRDVADAAAPWQGSTGAGGTGGADVEAVEAAALEAVGSGSRVTGTDPETGAGEVAWEVEVVDADGREHTVLLDADAAVLDTRQDD